MDVEVVNDLKSEIVYILDKKIDEGKKIILVDHSDAQLIDLLHKKILQLKKSSVEIWVCQNNEKYNDLENIRNISRLDMDELLRIYRLYAFSDNFVVIADTKIQGNLFNYVEHGILKKEELVDAIFASI